MKRWVLMSAALIIAAGAGAWIFFAPDRVPEIYAIVAFGDDDANRIGIVARGVELFLDRDPADGIEAEEYLGSVKCTLPSPIKARNGTTYDNISVSLQLAPDAISEQRRQKLIVDVDVNDEVMFSQAGHVEMSDQVDQAAVLQVDGELRLQVSENSLPVSLEAGGLPATIRARVITLHPDQRAGISLYSKSLRDGTANVETGIVAPDLAVEFSGTSDDGPIRQRIPLDEFC